MNLRFTRVLLLLAVSFSFSLSLSYADDGFRSYTDLGKLEDTNTEDGYKSYTDIGKLEDTEITVKKVVSSPDKYHRDVFTVEGIASDIEYTSLPNGRKFTLFRLTDSDQNKIKVYARGYIDDLEDGSELRLHGRYSKEKRFVFKKYKHVMKARKIQFIPSQSATAY